MHASDKGICFCSASASCGISSWGQFLAIVLVVTALILFSVLMSLLGLYMWKSHKLYEKIPQMRMWEKRLNDAIKLEAGDLGVHCKLCWDYTWLQRGGACYQRTTLLMPWKNCIRKCKKYGARLLKSSTDAEMEFMLRESRKWYTVKDHNHVPEKTWIGLIFNLSRNTWRWADGEYLHIRIPVELRTPFTPREFCVVVSNGRAFTNNCTEQISCLCKREMH
ncbi:killer cell lectin-like receptor subfamily F member 2 [Python bivittatus]|uniref:Killer cell lectin-like receptor subfamily F member 2 n=1 Tax=Python bivittatus TaxID=176946 RepID=A0A9F2RBL4_PYTBI|nr:killer cell lectin-like receptor subfamily F member 2 [Python bivittatus]